MLGYCFAVPHLLLEVTTGYMDSPMSTTTAAPLSSRRTLNPFKQLSPSRRREALLGYAFISPWLIGLVLFTLGPFIASFFLSFTNYSILQPGRWVGLDNYVRAFTNDDLFLLALNNSLD